VVFEEGAGEDPEADGGHEGGGPGEVAAPRPEGAAQLGGRNFAAAAPKFVAQLVVDADEDAQNHHHSTEYPFQTHNCNAHNQNTHTLLTRKLKISVFIALTLN